MAFNEIIYFLKEKKSKLNLSGIILGRNNDEYLEAEDMTPRNTSPRNTLLELEYLITKISNQSCS